MVGKKLNQSGAVSMLSVLVFSLIITVVTTAYIRSVISQQRNARNYDLSNQAYYAAESGVQDAVRALAVNSEYRQNGKTDCPPASGSGTLGFNTTYNLGYSCQLITVTPSEIEGSVEPNALSAMARLDPATPVTGTYRLVIRWSQQFDGSDGPAQVYYPRNADEPYFPHPYRWYASGNPNLPVHAVLRVNVIAHPKTTSFSRSQIKQRVVLLNPTTQPNSVDATGGGIVGFSYNSGPTELEDQVTEFINNAECYPSNNVTGVGYDNYSCKRSIRLSNYNLTNQTLYVRVGSVYHSTDFSVELTRDNGIPIPLTGGQAVIDVTGRAGDNIFRRVQQRVSLGGYFEDTQPDAALVAGEGICKLIGLGTTTTTYQEGCDPNP